MSVSTDKRLDTALHALDFAATLFQQILLILQKMVTLPISTS